MGIVELIVVALKLALSIVSEVFGAQARARAANEKYEIDKAAFLVAAQKCLDKMRDDAAKESQQAGDVEDQIDKDLTGKKP